MPKRKARITPDERRLLESIAGRSASSSGDRVKRRVRLNDEPLPFEPPALRSIAGVDIGKLEQNFVQYYTTHYSPMRAAIEAGYPASRAHVFARQLLNREDVVRSIREVEDQRLSRLKVSGDYLLNKILQVAMADPNELVQLWIPPCRYCYGKNFMFQRTYAEMERALEAYQRGEIRLTDGRVRRRKDSDPPFDEAGGDGYDIDLAPNPACPECKGRGDHANPIINFKDSRYLSADGRALYGGAKYNKDGRVEVLRRSQDAAWTFIARFVERWLEGRNPQVSDAPVSYEPAQMSVEELDKALAAAEEMGFDIELDGSDV